MFRTYSQTVQTVRPLLTQHIYIYVCMCACLLYATQDKQNWNAWGCGHVARQQEWTWGGHTGINCGAWDWDGQESKSSIPTTQTVRGHDFQAIAKFTARYGSIYRTCISYTPDLTGLPSTPRSHWWPQVFQSELMDFIYSFHTPWPEHPSNNIWGRLTITNTKLYVLLVGRSL